MIIIFYCHQSDMKIKESKHVCGRDRADIMGLTSNRFILEEMSDNAEEAINAIKLKDRSDLDVKFHNKYSLINGIVKTIVRPM